MSCRSIRIELEEQIKILTSEVEKLRLEIADLRKESKNSTRKISQLKEEASMMRFQKEQLANSIGTLTNER